MQENGGGARAKRSRGDQRNVAFLSLGLLPELWKHRLLSIYTQTLLCLRDIKEFPNYSPTRSERVCSITGGRLPISQSVPCNRPLHPNGSHMSLAEILIQRRGKKGPELSWETLHSTDPFSASTHGVWRPGSNSDSITPQSIKGSSVLLTPNKWGPVMEAA